MIRRSVTAFALATLLCGCNKKPEAARDAATVKAAPLAPDVLSNLVAPNAGTGSVGRAATDREPSPKGLVSRVVPSPASETPLVPGAPTNNAALTNLAAASSPPPKPPAPAEDIYNQGVTVLRTNLTSAATEEALILFRSAAEKGNPSAQHALGVALLSGLGIKKDVDQGLMWLEKSAAQDNPDALFKLASLRARGTDLPRDDVKAAELARRAAEQGHVEAAYNLATLYATGRGVPKDITEAAKWYRKAAEAGHATAQSNLGVLYATGEGLEKNPSESLKWWQKAAEQGQPSAQFNLAHALREGKIIPRDLIEAYKWYNLAAEQGDEDAAIARDAMAPDLPPADIAAALRRAREFKTKLYAKAQEQRPPF